MAALTAAVVVSSAVHPDPGHAFWAAHPLIAAASMNVPTEWIDRVRCMENSLTEE
jgi:predicted benzoate:H+ symporter BenE